MEMAYRERWDAEIAAMRRVLGGLGLTEECKWGKPAHTIDGKNIVIMQGGVRQQPTSGMGQLNQRRSGVPDPGAPAA